MTIHLAHFGLMAPFVALAFLSACTSSHSNSTEQPRIEIESANELVGKVTYGDKITHIFRFKNVGNGQLKIKNISSSCGCTVAVPSATELKPLESGEILVTVDTGSQRLQRSGNQAATSPFKAELTISTNDPEHGSISFYLAGEIESEFEFPENNFIDFGVTPRGESVAKGIPIKVAAGKSLRITGARSTDDFVRPVLEPGYRLKVIQDGNASPGWHFGTIVLTTTSKFMPELIVPVKGTISN